MQQLDGPHWQFSLRIYAQEGVPPACLHLQDTHGVDVNVLLLALYAGLRDDRYVGADQVASLDAAIREQRETVVRPLREIRRLLKPHPFGPDSEPLRTAIKKAELVAEQFEQLCLARRAATLPSGHESSPEDICGRVLGHFDPRAPVGEGSETATAIATISDAARKFK